MINKDLKLNNNIFLKDQPLKSTRDGFGDAMHEIAKDNPDVIALSADLSSSVKLQNFIKDYKSQFIQCGIAEQNMAGISAGLALTNKIPFMASFACFSPARNWDQIRTSIAQQCANVKIIGSHSGFSPASDGRSAQSFEDIALTRVLPNFVVIQPVDYNETKKVIKESVKHFGPIYIRLHRENLPNITTHQTIFEIGKAMTFVKGKDVTVISTGPIIHQVLKAVNNLKVKYKIECELINVSTIKPLDEDTILNSAEKNKKVVTIEEHQISQGLGGAVAELLSEKLPTKLLRIGVNDEFGQTGTYEELLDLYKLSAHHLEKKIYNFIK